MSPKDSNNSKKAICLYQAEQAYIINNLNQHECISTVCKSPDTMRGTHQAPDAMPYTLLQTLNYLSATNRAYFPPDTSQNRSVASRRSIQKRSSCRLVVCRAKTKHTKELLVFKATGPGKKIGGFKNLPCGKGWCLVCGKLLGKFGDLPLSECAFQVANWKQSYS
jgi:hypothetical protein